MLNIFDSVFNNGLQDNITVGKFLLCVCISLILGLLYYVAYSVKNSTSRSFKTALIFLPTVVCVVIMMVNGNIGIGIATAGTFSLVRFRSAQGTAKEIAIIFMTMCSGLIAGVGYLGYACLFTLIMFALIIASNYIGHSIGEHDKNRILKITIPEDLDYPNVFSDIFNQYTVENDLLQVKTTNMGSLFRLTYSIILKRDVSEKEFMDQLRVRNGNLEISILRKENISEL